MKKSLLSIVALALALASCNKDKPTSESVGFGGVDNIEDLKIPSSFNWATSRELATDISVVGVEGIPMNKVRVDIYDKDPYYGGEILFSGFTDAQGQLEVPVKIKSSLKEVVVVANALGVGGNRITASVTGGTVQAHFSGVPKPRVMDKSSSASFPAAPATGFPNGNVFYLGGYGANGVPSGMGSDVITQAFLTNIDNTLPEKNHLPCDPVRQDMLNSLFCNSVTTSKDDADVYVTFITEGAGFTNALAYYYHPAGSPPASVAAIDSIFVVFPNASEGGGTLNPGDKVKIGTFPANTTISWVLLANMYNPNTNQVQYNWKGNNTHHFFGVDALNADMGINEVGCPDPNFKQHMISLKEDVNGVERQIFAFEDINYPYGDYDFNDCIFYATGDLYPSCSPQMSTAAQNGGNDSDGDGVPDLYDDEPNNIDVACLLDFQGTLLFEDLWPNKGDFDFNDLVVAYDVTHAINAANYVHQARTDYTIKASGAGFNNGFGTKFSSDLKKSDIASISGRTSTGGFAMDGPVTATGDPSEVVIYNWDATNDLIVQDINTGKFFNTFVGGGKGNFVTENIVITFANGEVSQWELGLPPYNPFIFANQQQDVEIHKRDREPSDLHNDALFGTGADASNPGLGEYYKTAGNIPWVIDIPINNFQWPTEKTDIVLAYVKIVNWALTNGVMFPDWYVPANATAGLTYIP